MHMNFKNIQQKSLFSENVLILISEYTITA